ncbi:hypothetical protein BC943DRAFT_274467 [Umbelopsis sp. AD052]|nr:hypothetical protein BC943DRAFT_274467 [Umbelopsis sp. AD052]
MPRCINYVTHIQNLVSDFRRVVGRRLAHELRLNLKIHYRCLPSCTAEQKQAALAILHMLTRSFPQFSDWKDLVVKDEHSTVESLLTSPEAQDLEKSYSYKMPQPGGQKYAPPALYFDRTVEKLLAMFPNTDPDNGLPSDMLPALYSHYGYNQLPDPPKSSALRILGRQLTDFMVIILIVASIVEAAQQDFKSMAVLLVVIVLNTIIGFWQEFKASKTLEALSDLTVPKANVMRDGVLQNVDSSELVPGDLVILEEGEAIPADLRLIEVSQLQAMESVLTGESVPTTKTTEAVSAKTRRIPLGDCKGNAFMSTVVAKGRAKGIVVRTGTQTEIGKVSMAINSGSEKRVITPIQRKLAKLGQYLIVIAVGLCALVVGIGLAWKKDAKTTINIGLSLAVSVIPEGLIAVTTVTMALAVRRMAAANCIVRTLPAVETLGSLTVICSDKTGTLTQGKMTAAELWTTDGLAYGFTESQSSSPLDGKIVSQPVPSLRVPSLNKPNPTVSSREVSPTNIAANAPTMTLALMVSALCNNASISHSEGFSKVHEKAFDSERKLMSSVWKSSEGIEYVLCKGAPEEVLRNCTHFCEPASKSNPMHSIIHGERIENQVVNEDFINEVSEESCSMAKEGLRVLGLAYRRVDVINALQISTEENDSHYDEADLTFIGLIGLIDPPKEGVKDAIARCQQAGIKVIMITGDHVQTATAIATQLGIVQPNNSCTAYAMIGSELDLLSDEAILGLNPFPNVFARVSPDNKLKIVKALQERGEQVAMTGDGVNDAPAIKCASVGIAMGLAGTEITKQAADVVIADDNFACIVSAIEEGRHVFDNILKFIVYLLSCNGAEIFLNLVCAISGMELPFGTVLILWANIIADVPPAMAIGVEPKEMGIMNRNPRDPKKGVLTKVTWLIVIFQAFLICALTVGLYLIDLMVLKMPLNAAQSVAFVNMTTMQLLQSFFSRSISQSVFVTGIFGNKWIVGAFVVSFGAMVAGCYIPALAGWLLLERIGWLEWCQVLICCVIMTAFVEVEKCIIRRRLTDVL